jgi:putative LysE/RhtB family amino acid efflux pump
MTSLLVGFGLGAAVAAQLGPMSLFAIRTTLRGGIAVGLAIGAGVAAIDTLYAAAGALGAAGVLTLAPLRIAAGIVGAVVLAVLGVRTLWNAFRVRLGGDVPADVASPRRAFVTALGATASNPLTIASWAAVFAAASTAGAAAQGGSVTLLAGVGLGSLSWMALLASAVAGARRLIGDRLLCAVDVLAGAGLLAFAAALGVGTLRE